MWLKWNLRFNVCLRCTVRGKLWFFIERSFSGITCLRVWWYLRCCRFTWGLLIVSERIFDIWVYDWTETLLICAILSLHFKVFNLKYPPYDSEVLKIMIRKILIDSEIFAEIVGFFLISWDIDNIVGVFITWINLYWFRVQVRRNPMSHSFSRSLCFTVEAGNLSYYNRTL